MATSLSAHLLPRLLIIDDDPDVAPLARRVAEQVGFTVESFTDPKRALALMGALRPQAALVDLRMPDLSGIDVLRSIKGSDAGCQVLLMTGSATVDGAVEGVRAGALDYLSKPLDLLRLREWLLGLHDAASAHGASEAPDAFEGMLGHSAAMTRLFEDVREVAPHLQTGLVLGETGTGKELVARALHRLGPRRTRKLITLNCAAVAEHLFESELFGHVRGAFTGATDAKVGLFEHAHGGTLVLDEIGELPLAMQAKLLRAVEYGEVRRVGSLDTRTVDVCVVASTNRDLREEVAAGRFRADLLYRLGLVELRVPPLRARPDDIPVLAEHFVRHFGGRLGRPLLSLSPSAMERLQSMAWPGNVRQLRYAVERACMAARGNVVTERDVIGTMTVDRIAPSQAQAPLPEEPTLLSTAQRVQIQRAIHEAAGNKSAAARRLGVSRRSLYRWLDRLQITA